MEVGGNNWGAKGRATEVGVRTGERGEELCRGVRAEKGSRVDAVSPSEGTV